MTALAGRSWRYATRPGVGSLDPTVGIPITGATCRPGEMARAIGPVSFTALEASRTYDRRGSLDPYR
jgi:hypothetical protein